jgi:hypothetical protein
MYQPVIRGSMVGVGCGTGFAQRVGCGTGFAQRVGYGTKSVKTSHAILPTCRSSIVARVALDVICREPASAAISSYQRWWISSGDMDRKG